MKNQLLAAIACFLTAVGTAVGQPVTDAYDYVPMLEYPADDAYAPRLWVNTDYLLWWVKDAPQALPLIVVNPGAPVLAPGAATFSPGSVPVGGPMDYGAFSGIRIMAGSWVDNERSLGVEAGGFLLLKQDATVSAVSGANGLPSIAQPVLSTVPVFSFTPPFGTVPPPFGSSNVISSPVGPIVGSVGVSSVLNLYGYEINGLANLGRNQNVSVDALLGFRFVEMDEELRIDAITNNPAASFVNPGETVEAIYSMNTRNRFYGGQIGSRGEVRRGRFFVNGSWKVALGTSQQSFNSGFDSAAPSSAFFGTIPVYALAGPTNRNKFAVLPELAANVGMQVGDHLRLAIGYNFLYLSSVLRPGDQVTLGNPTQFPPVNGFLGVPAIVPAFDSTDFWAHGLNFTAGLNF
ncbi:MAG: BBP7 family outer membrane beta-barrel protein [Gemmataceae bacterium]